MNRYVIFLCGGIWQRPWFDYLKDKGHKILLVDPNETSPCVADADIFFKCDVRDIEKIYTFVTENNYKVELVTSEQTDVSALPVAILSKKFNTIANSVEAVSRFTNKYISREFVRENFETHIPVFKKVSTAREVKQFLVSLNRNIIIKPVDAQSSRGIYKIFTTDSLEQIEDWFKVCISYSSQAYVIAEEFIVGNEITLEGFYKNGQHTTLTGSNKRHFRTGIASDLIYPLQLNKVLERELLQFHNNLIEKTGLTFGITHAEYLINNEQTDFWLVEVACRGGGSLIPSHIVPWVTNVNLYDLLYSELFTETTLNKLHLFKSNRLKHATLHFFEFPSGKVKELNGVETCALMPGVLFIHFEFKAGDIIYPASDDRGRQGFMIVLAKNDAEVSWVLKQVYNQIKVVYETGV